MKDASAGICKNDTLEPSDFGRLRGPQEHGVKEG